MIPSKLSTPPMSILPSISEIEEDNYFNNLFQVARKYFLKLPHHLSVEKIQFIFDVDKTVAHKIYERLKQEIS